MGDRKKAHIARLRKQLLEKLGFDADYYPVGIEEGFPHILEKVVVFWESEYLDEYLAGLMVPDRIGRQGFPPDVAREIFRLATIHGTKGYAKDGGSGTGWEGAHHSVIYNAVINKPDKKK